MTQQTQQQSQEFLNIISPYIGDKNNDKLSEVGDILAQYIKNAISPEEASDRFSSLFGTNEIFEKIDDFLKKIKTSDSTLYQTNPNNSNILNLPNSSPSGLQPQVQSSSQNNPPSIQPQLQHQYINQSSLMPTKMAPLSGFRKKARPWTAEEDQRLTNAINANGTENWPLVATLVGGDRTRSQCSQRWHRVLDPKISKCNWSREEEQKLLNAVQEYGNKAWTRIATEMGNRSDVQCRFRYKFLLKKATENQTEIGPISASQDTLNQVSQSVNISQLQLGQYNNILPSSIQEDQIQISDQMKINDPSQIPLHILQLVPDNQKDSTHMANSNIHNAGINQNNDEEEHHAQNQNDEGQNINENNQS